MITALAFAALWLVGVGIALALFISSSGQVRAQRDFYAAERVRPRGEVLQFPNPVSEKSARPKSRAPSWTTMVRPKIVRTRKIGGI